MYPPQMRVFELSELTMKFKRHLDCEVIDFQILSEDYSKLAFLRADRTLEFHAKFGTYYKVRIPKVGTETDSRTQTDPLEQR
jgi:ribosome biogenesis protein ENP2